MLAARLSTPRAVARSTCQTVTLRQPTAKASLNVVVRAAAEEAVDNAFVYGENEAAAAAPAYGDDATIIPLPTYHLNILYLEKCIGIAIDQKLASGEMGPVTEYFMWPAKDAWDLLKVSLEGMPWISQTDSILLLNGATKIINFWQDEQTKHTIEDAKKEFEDMTFFGA